MPYNQELRNRLVARSQELNNALIRLFEVDPKDPAREKVKQDARQFANDAILRVWKRIPHDGGVGETPDDTLEKMYPELCGALEMVKFLVGHGIRMPPPLAHAVLVAALKKLT
jgi:hypothetical protein